MLSQEGSEIGEKENSSEEKKHNEEKKQNKLDAAMKRQKSCSGVWEEKPEERQKTPGSEDWDRVYSFEEKRLKSYIEGEEYGDWEKKNHSWELENGLVPLPEERRETVRIFFSPTAIEDQKKRKEAFDKRLLELSTKVLTEEEKKLKESYIQKRENWRLGLSKELFFPFGPGWDLAYHTKLPESSTVELPPLPSQARQKVPLTPEYLQYLSQKQQPSPVISLEDDREKLAAEERCLDGSYLTPYCKCDRNAINSIQFWRITPQNISQFGWHTVGSLANLTVLTLMTAWVVEYVH